MVQVFAGARDRTRFYLNDLVEGLRPGRRAGHEIVFPSSDPGHESRVVQDRLAPLQGLFCPYTLGDILVCAMGLDGPALSILGDREPHDDMPDLAIPADDAVLHLGGIIGIGCLYGLSDFFADQVTSSG